MVIPGIRGISLRDFLKHLYHHIQDHAIFDKAAQLSYYFVFALFPFIFFLVTLAAYLPAAQNIIPMVMDRLSDFMPDSALKLIKTQLESLLRNPRPNLLTVGLLVSVWSASRGVDAIRSALNLAYDVKESRPYWKVQLLAIILTVAGALLFLIAVTVFALGTELGFWVATKLHFGREYLLIWRYLRWPISAFLIMLALALTYYLLPDVDQEFKFITPGSVFSTVIWLLATWGFTQYVAHFGKYNAIYGSIGGVLILMTWLYITGLVFLLGGEVNAVIEHASREGKEPGAREFGEAPAPLAERASAAPPGAAKLASSAQRSRSRVLRFFKGTQRHDKPAHR
jgi:membrane protein